MSQKNNQVDSLYEEGEQWVQNLGEKTVHAKRMKGKFRNIKWLAIAVWSPFFFGPYVTWNGDQAILFDMEKRQYHLFDITIFPQDLWMLTMILLFLAILLAAMTTVLGRVFCGYFCFQTIWTDIFTFVENKLEGPPAKRRKLEKAPWSFTKIRIKVSKHIIWLAIATLSGVTWMLYFGVSWADYFDGSISSTTFNITAAISLGAYTFAGHMREQACLWICPYARIQGAMVDKQTIMPTYDHYRGEQRGKLKKGQYAEGQGDCIDCNQCVAVCPTGVDIRQGQEYGCITCGLCIDACDSVMIKVNKPTGLIRYTSLDEMKFNKPLKAIYKRPRVIVYSTILLVALSILTYGIFTLAPMELKVLHDRQPLFVQLSNGAYRNKYELKVMNKTDKPMLVDISFESEIDNLKPIKELTSVEIPTGNVKSIYVYLKAFEKDVGDNNDVIFSVISDSASLKYKSSFFTPKSVR
ncbi:MAG: cytochrome c oxidase accessory protein CcoG [Candidatus Ruthia sp.]|nr:cytochrome c oxidase accessory protein CcoG [Candidatus Ruthturnera sp.]MBT4123630.1 cytochrome c oxidase accessory protein CcoG [Candidatus Ruthturnera sp.]MBT4923085.1 cytochrome c oxidase accessory protein CcoG [Candidatus Thioglobus sp.]MBT6922361.1 cytochrome c oxidase accessory protein CcoG [Candidatus Ruthturnera sp.]